MNEFDIIRTYFDQPGLAAPKGEFVDLGIGDDCALFTVPENFQLACSMDILVEKVHFPVAADPEKVGWRALAVNLSDLAAMGAEPAAFMLGLSLPGDDAQWLAGFAAGLSGAARQYRCFLAGGDITRGPLAITIQVQGMVTAGRAISRHGAGAGDKIYVTGSLGLAGTALKWLNGELDNVLPGEAEALQQAFYYPRPRIAAARALTASVSAGIDVSDGLLADLGHICESSRTGAKIELPDVPVDPLAAKLLGKDEGLSTALHAGDDYELVLTVPRNMEEIFLQNAGELDVDVTCIGEMVSGDVVNCVDKEGNPIAIDTGGYQHFQAHD